MSAFYQASAEVPREDRNPALVRCTSSGATQNKGASVVDFLESERIMRRNLVGKGEGAHGRVSLHSRVKGDTRVESGVGKEGSRRNLGKSKHAEATTHTKTLMGTHG